MTNSDNITNEIDEITDSIAAVSDLMMPVDSISEHARDRIAILISYLTRRLHKKLEQNRQLVANMLTRQR